MKRLDSEAWTRVAFDDGQIVGVVSWEPHIDSYPGGRPVPGEAHLSSVFVAPDRWRRGIGQSLLAMAERSIYVHDYRLARLVTPEQAPARAFYEAHGWQLDNARHFHEALQMQCVGYHKQREALAH